MEHDLLARSIGKFPGRTEIVKSSSRFPGWTFRMEIRQVPRVSF